MIPKEKFLKCTKFVKWVVAFGLVLFIGVASSACKSLNGTVSDTVQSRVLQSTIVVNRESSTSAYTMDNSQFVSPSSPFLKEPTRVLGCREPQLPFVENFEVYPIPDMPEPPVRATFRDPVFGTCIIRVTDRNADIAVGDSSAGLKNEYSRMQSFNVDNSRILVRGTEGTWYLYDAASLHPLGRLPLDVDPRWSATDPNQIYYVSEARLMLYDLVKRDASMVHDFAKDFPDVELSMVWTRYEGSPSQDGRTWGLMAEDGEWLAAALLIYDLPSNRVTATLDTRNWPADVREVDSVTISPLGDYFLVYMDKYCEPGTLGTETNPCGLMVYDRELKHGRGLLRVDGYADTALGATGREILVYQDVDTDMISMLDLTNGNITSLFPIDFSHTPIGFHISGRAFQMPGWALISTYDDDPASYTWMDDQVFAVELKPGGRIVRLAYTHSLVDEDMEHDYWAEPQASVNMDLTRIVFTSNWGRVGTDEVEMYMILLPSGWIGYP